MIIHAGYLGSVQNVFEQRFGKAKTGEKRPGSRVLESLGVLPLEDDVQRLNLLECQVIKREST